MAIFDFDNYYEYIYDIIDLHSGDRGYKSKLARTMKVHPSLITRIADGRALMTLDQGAALAEFWGLNADEREYFHWLIMKARAGEEALRQLTESRLRQLRDRNRDIAHALSAEKMNPPDDGIYYLNWIYSAVHMLATLPAMTIAKIQRRLGLPEGAVVAAARTLEDQGFVAIEKTGSKRGEVRSLKGNVHLSSQKWLAALGHRNWRVASLERAGRPGDSDLRYTGVHTLSKRDLERLQRKVREFLVETDQLVRPSPEETLCVLCLDLFEL